jgi:hypothetical protein
MGRKRATNQLTLRISDTAEVDRLREFEWKTRMGSRLFI